MDTNEQRKLIVTLGFISGLDEDLRHKAADAFIHISEHTRLEAGTVLFTQGEEGSDTGYILLSGDVEVSKTTGTTLRCQVPELLGEMKQFNPVAVRTATVETKSEAEVLRFQWPRFEADIRERLDRDQRKLLKESLQNYAWRHFTE